MLHTTSNSLFSQIMVIDRIIRKQIHSFLYLIIINVIAKYLCNPLKYFADHIVDKLLNYMLPTQVTKVQCK